MGRKKAVFLLLVVILVFLGWMFPEWLLRELASIPYYTETATQLHKLQDGILVPFYDSFFKQPHMWLLEHIWTVAGGYALVSLFGIATTKDPSGGWVLLWFLCVTTLVLIVWFFGGLWLSVACGSISDASIDPFDHSIGSSIGGWLIGLITGLLALFLMLALTLTFWIGIPIYVLVVLLLLPNALYAIFRSAILLPFLLWQYLHYLFVPHPAETAYRAGVAKHLPTSELAASVAEAICKDDIRRRFGRKRYPRAWVSKNQEKRINALEEKVKANSDFLIELKRNLLLRDEFGN